MTPTSKAYGEATALARAGRTGEALAAAEAAIASAPRDASAYALKGGVQLRAGDPSAALATCDVAVELDPANARAHGYRGDALNALGRRADAVAAYDRAIALDPTYVAALVNRGSVLQALNRPADALESYDRALAVDPGVAQAYANRARALCELDRFDEALASADRAISLSPDLARSWARRGDALNGLERFDEALESFRRATDLQAWSYGYAGMAQALKALGRYDEAIAALDAAEAAEPGAPLAPYQRAMIRLMVGDFAAGWRDYEARWRMRQFVAASSGLVSTQFADRLTLGPTAEDLVGARVLVVGEQGIGDQLMHASLLPDLLASARDVVWLGDPRLRGLLRNSFPELGVAEGPDAAPRDLAGFDRIVASGSLGGSYRRTAADFPGTPFVAPRPDVVAAWAERLGERRTRLRVGISWRGGTKRTDQARRSMELDQLRPLLALHDAEFISLQYGEVAADVAAANARLGADIRVYPADEISDFEQLAGLVANLDVVVSVQTSLVHLCGALGHPCFAMVPTRPEWRYGASGQEMSWYRSVRVFRQDGSGDWEPVVRDVTRAVVAYPGGKSSVAVV